MINLSNERLKKIASWREKYGNGHNVMIPAEEAELMVRELLAYREAQGKPVACEFGQSNGDGSYSVVCRRYPIPSYIKVSPDWPMKFFYAAPQLPAVPDEWAVVPIKPTEAMRDAWFFMEDFDSEWAAMLAAAPKPGSDNVTDNTAQQLESLSKGSTHD